MKYLYIVDHFVPFPISEYGGMWTVIAQDDDECFDLISEDDDERYEKYYINLRERVASAKKIPLADGIESQVVDCFLT